MSPLRGSQWHHPSSASGFLSFFTSVSAITPDSSSWLTEDLKICLIEGLPGLSPTLGHPHRLATQCVTPGRTSTAGKAGPHSSKQESSSEERHDNPAIVESEFLAAQSWPSPVGTQSHTEQAGPCVLSRQGLEQACCQLQVPQPDDWLHPLLPFSPSFSPARFS